MTAKSRDPSQKKIASVQVEIGTVSQSDFAASVKTLMGKSLGELEVMERDYVAIHDRSASQESESFEPRYTYDDKSASSKTDGQEVLARIRGRMGSQ